MAKYIRKQLSFNLQNPEELQAVEVLDKLKRYQTSITILALTEFMEKYGLHEKSTAELKNFLLAYPYLKDCLDNRPLQPIFTSQFMEYVVPPSAVKEELTSARITAPVLPIDDSEQNQNKPDASPQGSMDSVLSDESSDSASMDIEVSEASKESVKNILNMFQKH